MPLGRRGRTFWLLAPARPPPARLCVTLVSKTLSWVLVNARSLVSLHSGPARTEGWKPVCVGVGSAGGPLLQIASPEMERAGRRAGADPLGPGTSAPEEPP